MGQDLYRVWFFTAGSGSHMYLQSDNDWSWDGGQLKQRGASPASFSFHVILGPVHEVCPHGLIQASSHHGSFKAVTSLSW